MKSKEILVELIERLAEFEAENQHLEEYKLNDFLGFLRSRNYGNSIATENKDDREIHEPDFRQDRANLLSQLIALNYRYTKEYAKKGLEVSKLQTVEEFSYLIVLMSCKHLFKTELILKNAMQITSGIEVIKRLLKKGFIRQYADKEDKRRQLVAITPDGVEEMKRVFPKMRMVSDIIVGNLTGSEQQSLIYLLQKLVAFHKELFLNHLNENLEDLLKLSNGK